MGRRAEGEHARVLGEVEHIPGPDDDERDVGLAVPRRGRPLVRPALAVPERTAEVRRRPDGAVVEQARPSTAPFASASVRPRPEGAFLDQGAGLRVAHDDDPPGQVGRQGAGDGRARARSGRDRRRRQRPRRRPGPAGRVPRSQVEDLLRTAGRDVDRIGGRERGRRRTRPTAGPRWHRPRPTHGRGTAGPGRPASR